PSMPSPAVANLLFFLLDKHKVAENVEEAFPFEHFFPKVSRAIAGWMLGITSPTPDLPGMAAAIERKEVRLLPREPRRHVNLIRVSREVHQRTLFEFEHRRARIAALFVLTHRMTPMLSGRRVL